jgi:hypothetical protein
MINEDTLLQLSDSGTLHSIVGKCDRLLKEGNIPELKSVLGGNYAAIRIALLAAAEARALIDEKEKHKKDLSEFKESNPRYIKLLLCERFYSAWCGYKAIGHWCGSPSHSEESLFEIHDKIECLPPVAFRVSDLYI